MEQILTEQKYKILLSGRNKVIIDDLFYHNKGTFTLLSTSLRMEDINAHLDVCKPDAFIICLGGETIENINAMAELKRRITRDGVAFGIIGTSEECKVFQEHAVYMADFAIEKPITAEGIKRRIEIFMGELRQAREEQEAMKHALELIKEQQRRKHVLVIDDDPGMLKIIKEHLRENYDVATAISGKIAYKFLENKKTDLILLDYEMPNESGLQVLQNLRNNEELASIPVLFLTGINDREKIKKVMMMKPQGYLLKPIDKEKLLGTIEQFIG